MLNISKKYNPKYLKVLSVSSIDEMVELSVFAFKEFKRRIHKNFDFFNVRKNEKYYKSFLLFSSQLCRLIYSENKKIYLSKTEFLKVCIDYFTALHETYKIKMNSDFYVGGQLHSVYSVEIFQNWVVESFGSFENYLNLFNKKKNKPTEVIPKERFDELFKGKLKKSKVPGVYEFSLK